MSLFVNTRQNWTKGKRPLQQQKQEIIIYRTNLIFMLAEPVNEYLWPLSRQLMPW
jgi:hypothetical protein